jgi:hypothetical protein
MRSTARCPNPTLVHVLCSALFLGAALPQPARAGDPTADLKAKLGEPWLKAAPWELDFAKAKAKSAESGLPIFAYFTRSYKPNAALNVLENGTFAKPPFVALARRAVLYCNVSSKVKGRPHADLLRRVGGRVVPYVALLDSEGRSLGRPAAYDLAGLQALLDRARTFELLRAQTERSADEELQLFLLTIEFGRVSLVRARQAAARIKLSAAERERVEASLAALNRRTTDQRVIELLEASEPKSQEDTKQRRIAALGPPYWELYRRGRRPGDRMARLAFFTYLLEWGLQSRAHAIAEAGLHGLELVYGEKDESSRVFLGRSRAEVAKLR